MPLTLLERAANWMARPPAETAQLSRDHRPFTEKHLLFALLLAVMAAVYGPFMFYFLEKWDALRVPTPLKTEDWRILPVSNSEPACPFSVPQGSGAASDCPADPRNPALWTAPERRELRTKDALNSGSNYKTRPLSYWVGIVVPPETLAEAARYQRTELMLGRITSAYRIWLDGQFDIQGKGWEETEPIFVHVPLPRLKEGRPLHVAIRVYNTYNSIGAPDKMNFDHGGEGFVKPSGEGTYRAMLNFTSRARPLMLMLAYTVMAVIFFFFWSPARVKQEYFYMALFAMFSALYEAKQVDLWTYRFSHNMGIVLDSVMQFYLCVFGLFLGLSFARARRAFFRYGIPLALLAPLPAVPKIYFTTDLYLLVHALRTWMLPVSFCLGASACLLQAWYLWRKRGSGSYLPVRIRRLTLFGAAMLSMGLFYFLEYNQLLPGPIFRLYVLTFGFEHFGFLMFFAAIALHEYGEQELRLAKTPVSQYHQRPILPEKVSGVLLVVDLKNSEELFRRSAKTGDAGKLVDTCISKMWGAVLANNGIVIQTEGDALRAFFDSDVCDSAVVAALEAADGMAQALKELESEVGLPLDFRGGIAVGDIRPIWQEMGANRFASWIEAGTSNPFVESTRLMDLERQVENRPQQTLLIVPEETAVVLDREQNGRFGARWYRRHLSLSAKHGVVFDTAVYVPVKAAAETKSAA